MTAKAVCQQRKAPENETIMTGSPVAEVKIDLELVTALVREQAPHFSDLQLTFLANGWDNQMYRLGADYIVRLPRREIAARLISHEQYWLPRIEHYLPVPVPAPVFSGIRSDNFPWPWSIIPWIEGEAADLLPLDRHQGQNLAEFLHALHALDCSDAPQNFARGVTLTSRHDLHKERWARISRHIPEFAAQLEQIWRDALEAPCATTSCLLHGDLHARNTISANGQLAAIIDWGDICQGDPASDLASIWMLLNHADARENALASYAPGAALIHRAKGWALLIGTVLLDTGLTDTPRHADMGMRIFRNLLDLP